MIRIKDIADRAGVSPTTVSNVIHGKTGRVSKATVEKINRILKEMEYVPSISARMLANNSSGLIGVALGFMKKGNASSFEDPFVSAMLGNLEYQIRENDWNFGYVESREGLREALNDFDEWMLNSPLDYLFSYNGTHLLVLILCTLFVFAKKGKGWKAMTLALPVLAYSYGTMLLLCGPTYRFFHFDSVIFIPLCLLLFSSWGEGEKTA